ncbi:MAG: ribbon-helix-helix protein, CopG family [Gemmataceae bacterium]
MDGAASITTPVNVRIDNQLKKRLDALLDKSGRSLTAVLRRFIERLVAAWESTPGEPANEELILFLTASQFAAGVRRAGGEEQLGGAVRQVIADWAGGRDTTDRAATAEYADLPRLVEAAQAALDRMLEAYTELPPYEGDLAELFTTALQAVPVRATIDRLVRESIRGRRGRRG